MSIASIKVPIEFLERYRDHIMDDWRPKELSHHEVFVRMMVER